MNLGKIKKVLYLLIFIASLLTFVLSLYDIYNDGDWILAILSLYIILIIGTIVLLALSPKQQDERIAEFEKTLHGKLTHFKCPTCGGIFALKKSRQNNNNPFTISCPDCGAVGEIRPQLQVVYEHIPSQKSPNKKFTCSNCGERVSLWAEGSELYHDITIFSCPYCGADRSMRVV